MTELDLKLAHLKSGGGAPTESSVYDHFSSLLQKIELKKMEVNTQQGYVTLIDEMVTYSTLTLSNAQISSYIRKLRAESASSHKKLDKMVCTSSLVMG